MPGSPRARWVRRTLTAAAMLAAAVAVVPAAAQAGPGPTPGAAGMGDVYYPDYGNGGYDVEHYDLDLDYRPATDELTGTATINARATQLLSSFNLDFALDVSSVRVNGHPASFAKVGAHELVVTPAECVRNHAKFTVEVTYAGIPSTVVVNGFTAWNRTADGAHAVNEPEISWWWYPSNDHPLDKATYEVSITVPEGTEAISNGVLTGPPHTADGRTRWDWRSSKPMATYLAFMAIGQYDLVTGVGAEGQPLINAFSANMGESGAHAKAALARTPEVIDWSSKLFGPYPFEAQGGLVGPTDGIGFALETQTRPVYSPRFWRRGPNMYVVVHELAHQWFGDNVSVHNWQDIWLNEGFATYAEWLWSEQHGEGTAQEIFDATYADIPAESSFWQVLPGDPGPDDTFHGAVYDRGAMAVHQLRLALGDKKFFAILTGWGKHKKYCDGSIAEFRAYAERLSGKDLKPVFTTWLYTPGRPSVAGSSGQSAAPAVAKPASWEVLKLTHELR